jgi:hypothetical protein
MSDVNPCGNNAGAPPMEEMQRNSPDMVKLIELIHEKAFPMDMAPKQVKLNFIKDFGHFEQNSFHTCLNLVKMVVAGKVPAPACMGVAPTRK